MTAQGEPGGAPPTSRIGRIARRQALLVLLGGAMQACQPTGTAETVELAMTEYRFSPDHLRLRSGTAYRLVLVNRGTELHEFTAPEFLAAVALDNPGDLAVGGKEVVVRPGERKELRFVAPRPGHYAMTCADHDWAGMTGEIVVN